MNNEPFQKHDIFHGLIPEKKKIDNHSKEDDSTA